MLTHHQLLDAVPAALETVDLDPVWGPKMRGKVRDSYLRDGLRVLITTDRVSAFDRVLGLIPYKGQVLNQLSAWWFEQTAAIVDNHLIAVPDPNVTVAREAEPLPVEVVVRGYITGVTTTSLWYLVRAWRPAAVWRGPAGRAAQERPPAAADHYPHDESDRRRPRPAADAGGDCGAGRAAGAAVGGD